MSIYNKSEVKKFIKNYHHCVNTNTGEEVESNLNEFFEIKESNDYSILDENYTDNHIYFNELDSRIETVATDREYYIFILVSRGMTFNKIGEIFDIGGTRVAQIFDGLLDKLP